MKLNTKYEMHGAGKAPLASWKKYMLVCGSKVSQFLERFQVRVPVPVLIRIRICVRTPFSLHCWHAKILTAHQINKHWHIHTARRNCCDCRPRKETQTKCSLVFPVMKTLELSLCFFDFFVYTAGEEKRQNKKIRVVKILFKLPHKIR